MFRSPRMTHNDAPHFRGLNVPRIFSFYPIYLFRNDQKIGDFGKIASSAKGSSELLVYQLIDLLCYRAV